MPDEWPRNIRPMDERIVALLGDPTALSIYLAVGEHPLSLADLPRVTGRPKEEAEHAAVELARAGLVRWDRGRYVAGARHLREEDLAAPEGLPLRLALLRAAIRMIEETERALQETGGAAKAGIGTASFPDKPELLVRAGAIVAEAEDQLRALAEEDPDWKGPRVRAIIFLGSTQSGAAPPRAP